MKRRLSRPVNLTCQDCGRTPEQVRFYARDAADNRPVQQRCIECSAAEDKRRMQERQRRSDEEIEAIRAEVGEAWCCFHQQYEPTEDFSVARGRANGCQSMCREGAAEYNALRRAERGNRRTRGRKAGRSG